MNVPKSVFCNGLDHVVTKYLKHTRPVDEQEMKQAITIELLKAAEALLFSPKVTFKVYGENVVAPLLINHFGVNGFHRLIDDGAVDFILWDQIITYMVKPIHGVDPLQYGQHNSRPHCNPKYSAEMGFNWWTSAIPRSERSALSRKIMKATRTLPKDSACTAVTSIREHARRGDLISYGINSNFEEWATDSAIHKKICVLAEQLLEGSVLTQEGTDLFHSKGLWDTVADTIRTIHLPDGLHSATSEFFAIEGLPDIPSFIINGSLSFEDVVKLRYRSETEALRRWLWARDRSRISNELPNEYMRFLESNFCKNTSTIKKAARISTLSIGGSIIGTAAGGPIGGIVGTCLGIASSMAISLFDGLIADRILHGDNPRSFASDVLRPLHAMTLRGDIHAECRRKGRT